MELNSTNVIVDANVWVAFFDKTDSLYEKAGRLLQQPPNNGSLLVSDYVLQESITVFLHKKKNDLITKLLDTIESTAYIEVLGIDSLLLASVVEFAQSHKFVPKISLTDWMLLYLAQEFQCVLLTFDKQLHNSYKRLV